MRRILLAFIASICILGVCSSSAIAVNPYEDTGDNACEAAGFDDPALCGTVGAREEQMMQGKVGSALNVVYGVLGILAVVFVIIGGFKYTTSQGDPGKVQQAKNTIMFSLIGLVVAVSAFAITAFILQALGSNGSGTAGGGSSSDDAQITRLEITSAKSMEVGKTLQIKVRISPDYATNKTILFTSSNSAIASVDANGLITSHKAGTVTITATAVNGGVKTSFDLKVGSNDATGDNTTKIVLDPTSATIQIGDKKTFVATTTPSGAPVTWSSSNTLVATVSTSGVVKGVKEGTVTIKAKSGSVTATATVKVTKATTSNGGNNGGNSGGNNGGNSGGNNGGNNGGNSGGNNGGNNGGNSGGNSGGNNDGSGNQRGADGKYAAVWEKRTYNSMEYWVNVPAGATDNMPLVLFLHGDGEMGNANAVKNLKWVQTMHNATSYIGLAPVGKNRDWISSGIQNTLKGLMDKYISDFNMNRNRIYVAGFSRGAIGTWALVNRYGSYIRAAVPVSCCGDIAFYPANFKSTKIYALAGSAESNYINCMKNRVDLINNAGGSARFETVAGATHSSITSKFPYSTVIDGWLLKQ